MSDASGAAPGGAAAKPLSHRREGDGRTLASAAASRPGSGRSDGTHRAARSLFSAPSGMIRKSVYPTSPRAFRRQPLSPAINARRGLPPSHATEAPRTWHPALWSTSRQAKQVTGRAPPHRAVDSAPSRPRHQCEVLKAATVAGKAAGGAPAELGCIQVQGRRADAAPRGDAGMGPRADERSRVSSNPGSAGGLDASKSRRPADLDASKSGVVPRALGLG
jgi:hypothetical protein